MTVTLLVALGIAAAQGCQGPSDRGLGGERRTPVSTVHSDVSAAPDTTRDTPGRPVPPVTSASSAPSGPVGPPVPFTD
ncbi:hypothetical protein KGS77_04615 [Streptomyces sp. MST-110588]|nr:hypothetical protein KGS77_04615 [Streptomyces sp. MST-110588]